MLAEEAGGLADFEVPDGGLAFWVRCNLRALDRIESRALAAGVWIAPSRSYADGDRMRRELRLRFASLTEQGAREGVRRLRAAAAA